MRFLGTAPRDYFDRHAMAIGAVSLSALRGNCVLITPDYIELNRQKHAVGSYGISGHRFAKPVDSLARSLEAKTVVDYGCGRGFLKIRLDEEFAPLPYQVFEYDPAIEGKTEKPLKCDLVACCDVLEHIEPECLYEVLDDIRNLSRLAVFLVIATQKANKHLADGRNAHLIVERMEWWLPKLMDRWKVTMFQDFGHEFMCVGVAR